MLRRDTASTAMMLDARAIALALGGNAYRGNILAPGPGHSRADRSLSIKIDSAAPEGFLVYSFAGDEPIACREHVRNALGLGAREHPQFSRRCSRPQTNDVSTRCAFALDIWSEAQSPQGTRVASYLVSRCLKLPDDVADEVIRFHPALKFNGERVAALVALFRDIRTNEPCGIHRTFFDHGGRKLGRKMLGRAKSAAIKLDGDGAVELGLHIGEGIETCLAAWLAGFRPVWALGSAGAVAAFPVLSGIEAITVLGEVDDGGASHRAAQRCAARWIEAGREAFVVTPLVGSDLNDVWREAVS